MIHPDQGLGGPYARRTLGGRRALDLAEGILMGLRRCSSEAAFAELLAVARSQRLSVLSTAQALVLLAGSAEPVPAESSSAAMAALREWGALLDGRAAGRVHDGSDDAGQATLGGMDGVA